MKESMKTAYVVAGMILMLNLIICFKLYNTPTHGHTEVVLSTSQYQSLLSQAKSTISAPVAPTSNVLSNAGIKKSSFHPIVQPTYTKTTYSSYSSAVKYASHLTGVSTHIIQRIIQAESTGDPNAMSSTGAVGLMQIIPCYGGRVGYLQYTKENITPTVRYLQNPRNNIIIGTSYFKYLLSQFKQYPSNIQTGLALASYNFGINNVQAALHHYFLHVNNWTTFSQMAKKYFPPVTQDYIRKIERPLAV
jgi:soluble lytic murein transglycosylase-like protein